MRILVVGGGGREHALVWKLQQSPRVERIYCAPGNAGTATEPGTENVSISEVDIASLLHFAKGHRIDLTVVGPEAPLVAGIVDQFTAAGLRCFGPTASAARLEASKAFAKAFMQRHGIPTPPHESFADLEEAVAFAERLGGSLAIKADGLASGKGVLQAQTVSEARAAVQGILGGRFGEAGERIVIERWLTGEEVSFFCLVDGSEVLPLASCQDHKPLSEGDTGPNTGGMGAYSPTPAATQEVHNRILEQIVYPTVAGMAAEGSPYQGILYVGAIITEGQPQVLEFNCRLGDPECQPLMMRLDSDLTDLIEAVFTGGLAEKRPRWDPRTALCVVQVAKGYPGPYPKGEVIEGLSNLPSDEKIKVFHAGTQLQDGQVVTAGGRVLGITALGDDIPTARGRALAAAKCIHWPSVYYRQDIGYHAEGRRG